jgi:DNA primase
MPRVSETVKEQIRNANDIVDVIGASLSLKKSGTGFVALCPFHNEKTPSFSVIPSKQIFHCFGCGKGGDVFSFVEAYENLTFMEALQRLAERAHITLEYDSSPAAQQQRSVKEHLLKLHEAVCQRWERCLATEAEGQLGRDYLQERGIPEAIVREFRIGMAPASWDDTVNWARSKSLDVDLLAQAGLVVKRESGGHYDRFRGRLIFPICDEQSRVIAFSGRILPGIDLGQTGKYVNSPETPLFVKGRVLFGLDKARRSMVDAGRAVVCEGQMDVIACHRAGIRHAVAPQGTALTLEQSRILKRYVEEVILCFDGDKAGQDAVVRALDGCLENALAIRVVQMPVGEDPDSILRTQGAKALSELLDSAPGFFDSYLQYLCQSQDLTTDRGRSRIVRGMAEKLGLTGNAVLIDTYAQRTAQRLSVSVDAVRTEFARTKVPRPSRPRVESPQERVVASLDEEADLEAARNVDGESSGEGAEAVYVEEIDPTRLEMEFLKRLLQADDALLEWVTEYLDPNWIRHSRVREVIETWLHLTDRSISRLLDSLSERSPARVWVTEAAASIRPYPELGVQLADTVKRLRDEWIDNRIIQDRARMMNPGISHGDQIDILRSLKEWKEWKRKPLEPLGEA